MRKFKIVVVENDEDERLFMRHGFDATDLFEVKEMLENGDALIHWLQQHEDDLPEIVLSDLNMHGRNGYDIIRYVKNNPALAHIQVIITSTSTAKSIIDDCLNLGADEYIPKPDTFIAYEPFIRDLWERLDAKQISA